MRVLWFTNTSANAAAEFGNTTFGGGWIAALENIVVQQAIHQLGICFFYNGTEYKKVTKNGVQYYGIPYAVEGKINQIYNRHVGKIIDNTSPFIDDILTDFKPDIIHVFGTEMGYGKLLMGKFNKVVFHIQGLLAPYTEAFFPLSISKKDALLSGGIKPLLQGLTFYHQYISYKVRAQREIEIVQHWKYFSGRTEWDRNFVQLINSKASYYHCDELLREVFFTAEWKLQQAFDATKTIHIGTTINPNIYKGLDLVYKVLPLLNEYDICWHLFGVTENNPLNSTVKKALNITTPNKSIQFHGQVNAETLLTELKKCHFFVHPSYIDNSPNSVCEAMLLGMPVISSNVGGVKSLITHNQNGFLFNPHEKFDLAGMLAYLINNYSIATLCAANARVTAMQRHNPNTIVTVLNNMYNVIYND
jgi:glycosyltransferase involved in cell wall biosynthesis